MLDVCGSYPRPAQLNAPLGSELAGMELAPPFSERHVPDGLDAVRGLAVALVISVPFWIGLAWLFRRLFFR